VDAVANEELGQQRVVGQLPLQVEQRPATSAHQLSNALGIPAVQRHDRVAFLPEGADQLGGDADPMMGHRRREEQHRPLRTMQRVSDPLQILVEPIDADANLGQRLGRRLQASGKPGRSLEQPEPLVHGHHHSAAR
jgi:hypothetical protein